MATLIIFAISLSVSASLVLMRALELRSGKPNFILAKLSRLDSGSLDLLADFKFRCLQIIQTARYIVLVQLKELVQAWVDDVVGRLAAQYHEKQKTILMGQKEIVANGSASFYLKKITEHKGMAERGKIEESL